MLPPPLPRNWTAADRESLRVARALLEQPSLAIRLASALGAPLERGIDSLPANWSRRIVKITQAALNQALHLALKSLGSRPHRSSSNRLHKFFAAASGGVGGAFGLPALAIELPISTTIMLRSIADIARSEGHDLSEVGIRLDCLLVFGMGGTSPSDDAAETGYWAVRAALAAGMKEAVTYLTGKRSIDFTAPSLVRLIGSVASRFGVSVSEQAAAKAIPIIGAASGAVVNVLFLTHFQNVARAHFIILRLEQTYGKEAVRRAYSGGG